ncbi:MAG: hypothetical protein AB7S38_15400 [Vulcanimicrobiota bacterium]
MASRLLLLLLLTTGLVRADTWFLPSGGWIARQLEQVGCDRVRQRGQAVGGLLRGAEPGQVVVFSSNDPEAALRVLAAVGRPQRGRLLTVFGEGIKLRHGDLVVKLDFDPGLPPGVVALPARGPSIDTVRLLLSPGNAPTMVIASDLVLSLQNRARTSSDLVVVRLVGYEPRAEGRLEVMLSVRVFDPGLRQQMTDTVVASARQRASLYGAEILESSVTPSAQSGSWPRLREALAGELGPDSIVSREPEKSQLYLEDFGRPELPTVILQVGPDRDGVITRATAAVLRLALSFER